ncbi:MAG TPA: hypothetical protein DCZ95_01335 [Verrucomicrobia bacterium]|nr:MAG: hypothetical protein A2X46_08945 [Lentisphaerae bacterium GWF2_57_35]HBA82711.1 hypothetical protein [Verrucomicrobiota bacterium]
MRRNIIFAGPELAFLKELIKNKVPFMIVGLSSAALQGAPVVTQDVDLWFKDLRHPGILKALKKVGGTYVPPWTSTQTPPLFAGEAVELFDIVTHMHGLESFDKEANNALEIPLEGFKVKVLPLERVIASKKAANRQKDRIVLPVLRDALVAQGKDRS